MQIIVEETLTSVNYLLEMNLQALLDMRHLMIRVKVLVLQKMTSGEMTEEVVVTATAQGTTSVCPCLRQRHVLH